MALPFFKYLVSDIKKMIYPYLNLKQLLLLCELLNFEFIDSNIDFLLLTFMYDKIHELINECKYSYERMKKIDTLYQYTQIKKMKKILNHIVDKKVVNFVYQNI